MWPKHDTKFSSGPVKGHAPADFRHKSSYTPEWAPMCQMVCGITIGDHLVYIFLWHIVTHAGAAILFATDSFSQFCCDRSGLIFRKEPKVLLANEEACPVAGKRRSLCSRDQKIPKAFNSVKLFYCAASPAKLLHKRNMKASIQLAFRRICL